MIRIHPEIMKNIEDHQKISQKSLKTIKNHYGGSRNHYWMVQDGNAYYLLPTK